VKRFGAGLALLALCSVGVRAQEVIPPAPAAHFSDYASLVRPATAASLEAELNQFEKATSIQVVVAIYPTMQSDSSVEDYTVRVAQSWHAGMKGKDNGAVLFIFAQSHQVYLQVGYGLEGALPDALAKRIISEQMVPAFRKGDYDAGVTAGVEGILAATRGEYRGTGRTVAEGRNSGSSIAGFVLIMVVMLILSFIRRRASMYQSGGRRGFGGIILPMIIGGGFGGGRGGGGGGGFSGGGGGFGGGGAGGSW
jgi:uncharacterized protein